MLSLIQVNYMSSRLYNTDRLYMARNGSEQETLIDTLSITENASHMIQGCSMITMKTDFKVGGLLLVAYSETYAADSFLIY